jgi:cyclic pyranopterin phosphate synthase
MTSEDRATAEERVSSDVPVTTDRVERPAEALPESPADRPAERAAGLTHVRPDGTAHMVDVSAKAVTARQASARGRVLLSAAAVSALRDGTVPKGDALAVARIAGIQAVKRTPELIPLAHPVAVHAVEVDLVVADDGVEVAATVRTADRTGIEMEALTAGAVAALALIDMVKAVDKHARITDVRVTAKSGGRSGDWVEEP